MSDERIKEAAHALALALTHSGREYSVSVDVIDVRSIKDEAARFAYQVTVIERSERQVAP